MPVGFELTFPRGKTLLGLLEGTEVTIHIDTRATQIAMTG